MSHFFHDIVVPPNVSNSAYYVCKRDAFDDRDYECLTVINTMT